ncbi:hypothetical protein IFR05_006355 [Cadophora sp. M221]|nr:hypothetical protein IFR05_006355 [Cadophora sp. M221]
MFAICVLGGVTTTIGGILHGCYACGALEQPAVSDPKTYMSHIKLVVQHSCYFNRIYELQNLPFGVGYAEPPELFSLAYNSISQERICATLKKLFSGHSLKQILGLFVDNLYRILSFANSDQVPARVHDLVVVDTNTFRVNDLNIKVLRSLGKLRIVWTFTLENHLLLDMENMTLVGLKDGWTGVYGLNIEVEKTLAILFATDTREKIRKEEYRSVSDEDLRRSYQIGGYEQMKSYEKLRGLHLECLNLAMSGNRREDRQIGDFTKELIAYVQFPIFETRLRQLRFYMDS